MLRKIIVYIVCLAFFMSNCVFAQVPVSKSPGAENAAQAAAPVETITQVTEVAPGFVTVNFKGADIKAVLSYLSEVGGVDIVPSPDVAGPVTLKLTNKPWQTALDIIVRNYGFAYERDGDIIRVVTVDSLKMEELATEIIEMNYAKSEDILESIKDMLSERGKISHDPRTNFLVITDVPANIYRIKQVLGKLDKKTPQIMIEAKIIETELNKTEKMGIDWNIRASITGAARPITAPFDATSEDYGLFGISKLTSKFAPLGVTGGDVVTVGLGGATVTETPGAFPTTTAQLVNAATKAFPYADASLFTYGSLDFSQFSAVLEYLKKRANTEVISNPRITTLNNKEAKIFVGSIYNYISKQEYDTETKERTYEYKEKEIGIRLLVTPNINDDGEIVVKLKPEIKDVIGYQQLTSDFQLPIFSTREAETEVMIKDKDTIFIGGLIKENNVDQDNKFPVLGDWFGDTPFLGNLVKWKGKQNKKTELIFFITVHVVSPKDAVSTDLAGENGTTARAPSSLMIADKNDQSKTQASDKTTKDALDGMEDKKPVFDFRKTKTDKSGKKTVNKK